MVGLVARREVVTRVRERSFLLSTLVILGILTAIVVLPQLLEGDGREEVTVAAAGADGRELVRAAQPAGAALGLDLQLRPVAGEAQARRLVAADEADLAVVGGGRRIVARPGAPDAAVAAVQQAAETCAPVPPSRAGA
jgi:ABC-2 type transport system permease protein